MCSRRDRQDARVQMAGGLADASDFERAKLLAEAVEVLQDTPAEDRRTITESIRALLIGK
jgi:hypothetical protein